MGIKMSWGWGEFQKIPPKSKSNKKYTKEVKNESTEQNRERISKPKAKH